MNFLSALAIAILSFVALTLIIAYVGSIVKIANAFEKAVNSFDEWVKRN